MPTSLVGRGTATQKVGKGRIVFDPFATCKGKRLNTEPLAGPKLQSDIAEKDVSRKDPVALVGVTSQMYHQLVLQPEDRALHRFLLRNSDQSKEPETYEFVRFVFGGCYLLASLVPFILMTKLMIQEAWVQRLKYIYIINTVNGRSFRAAHASRAWD